MAAGQKRRRAVSDADDATVNLVPRRAAGTVTSVGFSETLSRDGRRITREKITVDTIPQALPSKSSLPARQGTDDSSDPLDFFDTETTPDETEQSPDQEPTRARKGNQEYASTEHDGALQEWLLMRDAFLNEMLRLEGLRGAEAVCARCEDASESVVRCRDCCGNELLCASCCVTSHAQLPFHVVESWDGRSFNRTCLADLGLSVQLGHPVGESCDAPYPAPSDFMVLHTNGWHRVALKYCECDQLSRAGDRVQQLLRFELFPATVTGPTTCATFCMLETFHALTLQAKTTVYDWYLTMNNITDNTGTTITWDRVKQLLRMVREWRHLKALKRAGRGSEGGATTTSPGELCIRCPACPRPGVNLPAGWEKKPDSEKFIYTMFLAVDANFRLKRRAISSNERDPPLGSGWGYFVESAPYLEHVMAHASQEDMSSCTGFAAISQANTRYSKGYASTGVGMVVCARHGFILPNAVGDLQKGERYCNMDYIVASALKLWGLLTLLVISYDIACQWALRFLERIARLPPQARVTLPAEPGALRYAIPKYHFHAHREEGHNQYSLNLMTGVGRVCGEQIERTWPKHSEAAGSTQEMCPGSRADTLEDHFGYTNWRVYINLGSSLHRQHKLALRESRVQEALFNDFRATLDGDNLAAWDAQVLAYEKHPLVTFCCNRCHHCVPKVMQHEPPI